MTRRETVLLAFLAVVEAAAVAADHEYAEKHKELERQLRLLREEERQAHLKRKPNGWGPVDAD